MHPLPPARVALAAALLLASAPAAAQTIYVARTIHTMNPGRDVAAAVAVDGGYIRAVGSLSGVQAAVGGGYTVDSTTFRGQVLLPGFVEAHTHLQFYGLFSRVPYVGYFDHPGPDRTLHGIQSPDGIIGFLRSAVAAQDSAGLESLPLLASGADPIYFGGERFTKALLDSVSTVTPILLQLGSGHLVIVNTPMLRLLESTSAWAALPAASVVRDAQGKPTGELDELQAVDLAFAVFLGKWIQLQPPEGFTTMARMRAAVVDGGTMMQRAGITTATEMLFASAAAGSYDPKVRALYQGVVDSAGFPVRVVLGYDASALLQSPGPDGMVLALQNARALDTEMMRTGPVKIIVDGSIQGYTAQLKSPGYIRPGFSNPMWNVQPDSLAALARPFIAAGFPVAFHVNGDSASAVTLRVLQGMAPTRAPGAQWPGGPDSVWATLQHNQVTRPEQYRQARALRVGMNLFANHIYYYGEQHALYTIGPGRADSMNAAALAQQLGIPYSLHSDAPVTPAQPLFAAWVAMERLPAACLTSTPPADLCPLGEEQKITLDQALYAITMGGATLLNMAGEVGSIEPGKRADFVALGADPYALPADMRLKDVPVVATMVGGRLHPVIQP